METSVSSASSTSRMFMRSKIRHYLTVGAYMPLGRREEIIFCISLTMATSYFRSSLTLVPDRVYDYIDERFCVSQHQKLFLLFINL